MAVFVGFVPADRPKLVILVMIDEPKGTPYGGLVAGPVFREVGAWALNTLRIHPQLRLTKIEDSSGIDHLKRSDLDPEPELYMEDVGLLPDFRGQSMREVLKKGRALGLRVVLKGTGLAVNQNPGPGSSLENITAVQVNFRPPI